MKRDLVIFTHDDLGLYEIGDARLSELVSGGSLAFGPRTESVDAFCVDVNGACANTQCANISCDNNINCINVGRNVGCVNAACPQG